MSILPTTIRATKAPFPTAVLAAATLLLGAPGAAQEKYEKYPTRTVEIVAPFAAGGGTDVLGRLLADGFSRRLGQSFVVLNRPGANTNLGTQLVAKARPDGHMLVITSIGLAANPSLYRNLGFDPRNDLAPISLIANAPTILVVNPSFPAATLKEFIAFVKSRPGGLNYASYGAGSGPHLAAELFKSMTGTNIVHVPYGGGGPAAVGVTANQVQMLFASVLPVLGLIRGGNLRPIAIASERRSALLPDVPTFAEEGLDYRTGTWFGLLAPAKTPDAIIATLHATTVAVLREPEVRARLAEQGADIVGSSPAAFKSFIASETDRLAAVIRNAKIHLD
jgi:tripartite-type tricarboxylate transporter receptor subunit TctC